MHQQSNRGRRDGFSSNFGVLAATLGSAVGLGNIWKFPSLTGENGGAAFLLVYLLASVLIGLPVMIAEIAVGRRAKANPITALQVLSPNRFPWWLVGVTGMLAALLILAFYSEVVAWVFAHILKAIGGSILSSDPDVTGAAFESLIRDPVQSLVWQWIVLAFISAILLLGVSKGIEAITKRLMPLLFFLLILLCAVSLSLARADEGLAFLFKPDFESLTMKAVLTAMGLAFFKMSIGMGTMITYGSYFRDDQDIPRTALRVMVADLVVSMLAGIAIFPAVFTFGFAPTEGPSLVFVTIPAVFSQIPLGHVLMVLFFILTAVAATGAMLSLMEVPVVILHERLGLSRRTAVLLSFAVLLCAGALPALSQSVLADTTVWGWGFFALFDRFSSNILLPLGGILIALFVGWAWGRAAFTRSISNDGQLANARVAHAAFLLLRYVTPLLIALIMLEGLGIM